MDYTTQPLRFRILKLARYIQLYGFRRTWIKVQGQYHMKRVYGRLPDRTFASAKGAKNGHVGIIGCGNFAFSNIAYYLEKNYGPIIRACMDTNLHRAASLREKYSACYFTDNAEDLNSDPRIDLIYIASNHASHAEYAIRALESGKTVHVEKPHCVTEDQLRRLCHAMSKTKGKLALGFNRPGSPIGARIRRCLDSEPGPAMLSWFVAGHQIDPDHWYFRQEEGGRVLGNLCHWTDFLYQMVPGDGRFPLTINPTRSRRSDCDIAVTFLFADGTIGAITFSAKGHVYEGVRERFAAHKGNVLIAMDDFKSLTIEVESRKRRYSGWYRNHGHERRICDSYRMLEAGRQGADLSYVWETGMIFLKTREALETNRSITLPPYPHK